MQCTLRAVSVIVGLTMLVLGCGDRSSSNTASDDPPPTGASKAGQGPSSSAAPSGAARAPTFELADREEASHWTTNTSPGMDSDGTVAIDNSKSVNGQGFRYEAGEDAPEEETEQQGGDGGRFGHEGGFARPALAVVNGAKAVDQAIALPSQDAAQPEPAEITARVSGKAIVSEKNVEGVLRGNANQPNSPSPGPASTRSGTEVGALFKLNESKRTIVVDKLSVDDDESAAEFGKRFDQTDSYNARLDGKLANFQEQDKAGGDYRGAKAGRKKKGKMKKLARKLDKREEKEASGEERTQKLEDLEKRVETLKSKVFRQKSQLSLLTNLPAHGGLSDAGDLGIQFPKALAVDPIPDKFLPSKAYFENTYLGGTAAYQEQLRRLDNALASSGRPHRLARPPKQAFDSPSKAGLNLSATMSTRWFDKPQRMFLQVGVKGSDRYGWRRPPLEMVLVVDSSVSDGRLMNEAIRQLLRQLGPKDSLGVVLASDKPRVIAKLDRLRILRTSLLPMLDTIGVPANSGAAGLAAAISSAQTLLSDASTDRTTLPGTQTVLVLTAAGDEARVGAARAAAHRLTVRGVVTSVIQTGSQSGAWWSVANAGHGNYHSATVDDLADAVKAELDSLAKVVARLLRLNVRLAPHVKAVRILGSRILDEQTVKRVKAREVAADKHLSRSLGIEADRGDDDNGLQTVIPYFYGGDAHVVVLELWVTKPGKVADISLQYKDMVNVDNAVARTAVSLRNVPREPTGAQHLVDANLRGFELADSLVRAAEFVANGSTGQAKSVLNEAGGRATNSVDRQLVSAFSSLVASGAYPVNTTAAALRLAGRRKVGGTL
ncbi:MAG: hypothetical protein ACI9OJ_003745 [Myxococcota bacterium]|jgi:hypothetical protein